MTPIKTKKWEIINRLSEQSEREVKHYLTLGEECRLYEYSLKKLESMVSALDHGYSLSDVMTGLVLGQKCIIGRELASHGYFFIPAL